MAFDEMPLNEMRGQYIIKQEVDMEDRRKETSKWSETTRGKAIKEIISWIVMLAIGFSIAHLLTNYVVVNARIPSGSMQNTIMKGDKLLANRLSYISEKPERGDIVVFKYPVDREKLYIKRIIGLPNETVEIIDGKIYINGSEEPLEENYLPEKWDICNDGYAFHVPEGCYLMLGDNRNNSSDSRYWAVEAVKNGLATDEIEAEPYQYVKEEDIVGKAILRYWPITDFKSF